ncbi:cobalt-precorrin 5A hydrolase [Acerihabitans arboris]|uniref:Cobalt-precorrin 5A hydrolase n=1 Tax=Acerihabitans arboris TaxID=2691583 RepID=A0A845SKN8_9GAMM|nr:cobalt-precorrin 5A hydrolase [Acerihabitans arboris]NDL63181.1 cobalt-precorrin 5A hydrolase [Acerihabitans arboris]
MNIVKPESVALFCLTPGGVQLAKRLAALIPMTCFTSQTLAEPGLEPFRGTLARTVAEVFNDYSALIFICATGLTVRVIAPLIKDKFSDPAVVVIDDRGHHAISLLSGHMGGANALTGYIAGLIGATPVITTATDVNQLAAVDILAQQLNATMTNFRRTVKKLNQLLVCGGRIGLYWDQTSLATIKMRWPQEYCDTRGLLLVTDLDDLPELDALLYVSLHDSVPDVPVPVYKLVPRCVVAGIGCKRDTPPSRVSHLLARQLAHLHIDPLALRAIGSVSIKSDEPALRYLANQCCVPFETFSVEVLKPVAARFPGSDFVKRVVGIGSVSQPVAWLMSNGRLVGDTLRTQGVTITLGVSC